MAINPAPMDQCTRKCRCLSGPNGGLAYNCDAPCPDGQTFLKEVCDCRPTDVVTCANGSMTLTSDLILSDSTISRVTTFYPGMSGYQSGGISRVIDGNIQAYNGTEWITLASSPFSPGDTYNGLKMTQVFERASLSAC